LKTDRNTPDAAGGHAERLRKVICSWPIDAANSSTMIGINATTMAACRNSGYANPSTKNN